MTLRDIENGALLQDRAPDRIGISSLAEAFDRYVAEAPDALALACSDEEGAPWELDRRALGDRVELMLQALAARGVGRGDTVILGLPTCVEFVALYWALQKLGATAVPTPGFDSRGKHERRLAQLADVCDIAEPRMVVVSHTVAARLGDALAIPVTSIADLTESAPASSARAEHADVSEALSVLQFTSGSTGAPRGCALTQRAILANAQAIIPRIAARPHDVSVSWLPLHHDMGLMTGVVLPVVAGAAAVLRSPTRFLANPLSWLKDLSTYPRSHTATPNFALTLVMQRLERRPPDDLDLSGVVTIVCGAEPIDPSLAGRFVSRLAAFGLRPDAFHPAYGMAEATLMVTSHASGLRSTTMPPVATDEDKTIRLEATNLGRPLDGVELQIVDERGAPSAEGVVGEVVVASPALMEGYYRDPEATQRVLANGRYRTGDLGFVRDGDLHVVGRIKDIIIVSGRNLYPSDIENAVAQSLDLAPSRVVAVGLVGTLGTEDVHIVVEARGGSNPIEVRMATVGACFEVSGVTPTSVTLVASGLIPRTTSGKVRRHELRQLLSAGAFEVGQ